MSLVERFIEFDHWPTSRKTALASGFLLFLHAFASPIIHHLVSQRPRLLDVTVFDALAWPWLALIFVSFVVSFVVAARRREGRWTLWLLVIPYVSYMVAVMYAAGPASTALTAWFGMAQLLIFIFFGVRPGLIASAYGFCLVGVVLWLQSDPHRAYAPFLLDRSLDAQRDAMFTGGILYVLLQTYAACTAALILLLLARRLQETRLRSAQQLIRRYVPSQLAERIISGQHAEDAKPERVRLTIFFSDLVGFSDIAEELEPEDLSRVLNEYFSEMTAIARRHGGTVDELTGDAILIFFGAPNATTDKDHALRAASMALEMQRAMDALNETWRAAGITETLRVRMAINTGVVTIGNFGSPDRMKYAVLGKHVNVAARLQSHCEPGKILLSYATWLLVNDQFTCPEKGPLQLKGIHKPVMSYELAVTG